MTDVQVQAPEAANGAQPERHVLTVSQIMAAPSDCREEWLEVPEWGGWVKLRSPTALVSAEIKNAAMVMDAEGRSVGVDVPGMERTQVRHGVVEPALSEDEVRGMQERFGPAFNRIVTALDRLSGVATKADEAKLRASAERSFRAA